MSGGSIKNQDNCHIFIITLEINLAMFIRVNALLKLEGNINNLETYIILIHLTSNIALTTSSQPI